MLHLTLVRMPSLVGDGDLDWAAMSIDRRNDNDGA